jgi:photosystem II stability/assembly factor-like uncharacterized protein
VVLALGVVALVAGLVRVSLPAFPGGSCAGCGGTAIWAVAAFDSQHIVAVGGTDDDRGNLVLLRSQDGGKTWAIERPNAPALTSIAIVGGRLYGSIRCLPEYPPDYALPSDADVEYGPGVDMQYHPAPESCLYYSDDLGRSWHETGAGRLVDPTFADASNGWAQSPYDPQSKVPSLLYSTLDGGRTWHDVQSPCDTSTPWIEQAVATGHGAGYVLCVGSVDLYAEPPQEAAWELVEVRPGAPPVVRLGSRVAGVPVNTGVGGFFMRSNGRGWVFTYAYGPARESGGPAWDWTAAVYRTRDGGQTWEPPDDVTGEWPGVQGVSFVSDNTGFAAFRSTGAKSGILTTSDGGRTWRMLAAWDWWSFDPIPLPS